VSDDLVCSVDQNISERRHFTISELLSEFSQISRTILYEIVAIMLGCYTFCAKWVPKMLTGVNKMQRMALALTF
jgi:hypothetical protein